MQRALTALVGALTLFSMPANAQRPPQRAGLCEQIANTPERARTFDDVMASGSAPGHIVGQVVNREGQPLEFSRLDLLRSLQDTLRVKVATTNSAGNFRLDSVPPGRYILAVHRLGYQRQWHALLMLGSGADTLCIRLRPLPFELQPIVPARRSSTRGE